MGWSKAEQQISPGKRREIMTGLVAMPVVAAASSFVPDGGIPVTQHISKCWILTILCHSYNITHLPFKGIAKVRVGNT